jgi:hypothetical protein
LRKLVPILALTLCALLLLSLATPAAAQGTFPADDDQLDYEIRVDTLLKLAQGPPDYDYDIEIDMSHLIQNSSNDFYYANMTWTWVGPSDLFGPYTGESNWTALMHHYQTDEVPHIHIYADMYDWTSYSPFWFTDLFYITPGLEPGDAVHFGYSDMTGPPGTTWYENNTYWFFGVPVMAGPAFVVGGNQLSTVKIGMHYEYHENVTLNPSPYYGYWDMEFDFEMIWEWSLGFLCQINFDYYVNTYPYSMSAPTEIFVTGNMTLVDYSLAAAPVAYGIAPGAELLPIIIAVVAIIIIICIIIFFLIWRSRQGK